MGRYNSIEIKGLFFKDFLEIFEKSLVPTITKPKLTDSKIIEKIESKIQETFSNYEDIIASQYLKNHTFKLQDFLRGNSKNQKFIATSHKDSFVPFFLYINGCATIYEEIIKKIPRKRIDTTLRMNIALYGLLIRRADEIGSLLLNGYIDGAMIIWRSLFENSISLLLLAKENDPQLADRFYSHSVKGSKRKISSYTKNHKELKFKPLSKATHTRLGEAVESINKKYGQSFLENEFGWADHLFSGKQKANLRLLEEKVGMSRYRPYYLLCCEHIHSSFNGFNDYTEDNRIILPHLLGQALHLESYIDPMQFTISILHDVNDYILFEFSTKEEYEANVLLMTKIFDELQESFTSISKKRG